MEIFTLKTGMKYDVYPLIKRGMIHDQLTDRLIDEKIWLDPNFNEDLALVAAEGGIAIGFIFGTLRGRTGCIKFIVVERPFRRKGIGNALLEELESRLADLGASSVRIDGSAPNYLNPGLDPRYTEAYVFFSERGYKVTGTEINMSVDLNRNFDTSEREKDLLSEGIEVLRATADDKESVLEFIARTFPGWRDEVHVTFSNDPISLHIAKHKGRPVAFAAYDANNLGTGWFGPMGTDPDFRGKGIGGVLLKRCLIDIRDQGHTKAIIPWVGPVGFYVKEVGANISRLFWRMEKELTG